MVSSRGSSRLQIYFDNSSGDATFASLATLAQVTPHGEALTASCFKFLVYATAAARPVARAAQLNNLLGKTF